MGPVSAGPRVFIATPMYGGMASAAYAMSLAHAPGIFFRSGVGLNFSCAVNDSLVTRARNYLTHQFLNSTATHLMWIDADIGFDPTDIIKMVQADKDIVCGIYPKKEINWNAVARAASAGVPPERLPEHERSLVVNLVDNSQDRVTADGLIEIANAGTGFMLIKRNVFEVLAPDAPSYVDGSTPGIEIKEFYAVSIDRDSGNSLLSEDYHFCKLARDRGFAIYAASWVRLNHTGTYIFGHGSAQ
ncbi:ANP1/MMN9/VAN1 family protein [Mycobacterium paraterrae]|uniref:ANP1/MMN9/VAN1 family protein n=1 Tax=Mycobacterium paraterrae TaxID=577492 RepID=A0ABY3VTB4_9MYCO|nr:ANP1/MMN9/VAN1 family protein [Mycobacterium paraterrae]UMB70749.1 ANP1/MMN9/VAN1 family protein [Mycobacterium paraterrae]